MRVTIHQPEHLPWLGLLSKIHVSDLWIVLDSVPYRKNYFQNRNRVLADGVPGWLTVPVTFRSGTLIRDITVAPESRWQRRYLGRLGQALPVAMASGRLDQVSEIISNASPGSSLLSLNMALIDWMCEEFGIVTPRVMASDINASGHKSDLILSLCLAAKASQYLAGPSGRDYLKLADFAAAGVEIRFHDYHHPTYDQGGSAFVSHLSAVDAWGRLAPGNGDTLRGLLDNAELSTQ